MNEIHYPDTIRSFLDTGFDYNGHQVRYETFASKYDGCVMTVNIIDGVRYPYLHRTQGSAERSAKRIIEALNGEKI